MYISQAVYLAVLPLSDLSSFTHLMHEHMDMCILTPTYTQSHTHTLGEYSTLMYFVIYILVGLALIIKDVFRLAQYPPTNTWT